MHIRYVSRTEAVVERNEGAFFRNMPKEAIGVGKYRDVRASLEAFAWAREESETALHQRRGSRGIARSHYRCVLSFEREVATPDIRRMVEEWLRDSFPLAVVAGFVHRNTDHVHVHCWIDARGVDGKKLDFSPREYRRIGAGWDRIYTREIAREDRLLNRFGEEDFRKAKDWNAKGGAPRGGIRTGDGTSTQPSAREGIGTAEQAIRACAESRNRAIRESCELRLEVERLARKTGCRDNADRSERGR